MYAVADALNISCACISSCVYVCTHVLFSLWCQAAQQEDNFFEKARRCVLRAMGVGRKSTLGRPGSARSSRDGTSTPIVAATAEEIALRHKIKVGVAALPGSSRSLGRVLMSHRAGLLKLNLVLVVSSLVG